ncbi:hypothetical protein [Streptomyces sp. NPDC057301]|uniref:hypothetical protein n=1 Tax=Streptomyces sp. NPDC057301 TaxID=3346093 RepID=UPI003645060A
MSLRKIAVPKRVKSATPVAGRVPGRVPSAKSSLGKAAVAVPRRAGARPVGGC